MSGFGGSWGRAWGGGFGAPVLPPPTQPTLVVFLDLSLGPQGQFARSAALTLPATEAVMPSSLARTTK